MRIEDEKLLNRFATSLYGNHSLDDILWNAAESINQLLGFEDCVIYEMIPGRNVLKQRAASGPKKTFNSREILNPIEIKIGEGITGSVALSGKPERIGNTSLDSRYMVDDVQRLSELTVPIRIDDKLFGIIDSEHPQKNFYTRRHLRLLQMMTTMLAERIKIFTTEDNLRIKISRDLHDEIGSTLTGINVLSKVAGSEDNLSLKARGYLQKIHQRSAEAMDSMSDIVWVINPANDTVSRLILKMKEWMAEILEPSNIAGTIHVDEVTFAYHLKMEEWKNWYLMFKEAVTNAVKYSQCSHLKIEVGKKDEVLFMRIADDGIGFEPSLYTNGNGLQNLHQRAAQLGGRIKITSAPGKGTIVYFEKPISKPT